MSRPYVKDIKSISPSPNVCEQELRELAKLKTVSMAHVTMKSKDSSLLHKHDLYEVYFALDGSGILYHGNERSLFDNQARVFIDKDVPHKLKNIQDSSLTHLVFASPAFDTALVKRVNSSRKRYKTSSADRSRCYFGSSDDALIYSLLTEKQKTLAKMSLVVGTLSSGKKAGLHKHNFREEVYYVLEGNGKVKLNKKNFSIKKDSVIYVPPGTVHGLENTESHSSLDVLCLCSPQYSEEDDFKV